MNLYRTVVIPPRPPFHLSHEDKIVSIGSCFSENIGKKLREHKFNININPFGQQYNPYSVVTALRRLLNPVLYKQKDLIYHDELFHSYDHHGDFSRPTEKETLELINENLVKASDDLKSATTLFLTFGTSHVFRLKKGGKIVSNCHKLSGSHFERDLLSPEEIVDGLEDSLRKLREVNPSVKIIFTVSPVRYFAFGHYENSVSKSHLFTAIYEIQRRHADYYYFPAYELVMDDLRDYRFFAEDMLHPNYEATNYVWQSLCETMMSKETLQLMKQVNEIVSAVRHRPRNPNSEAHRKFVAKAIQKIGVLEKTSRLNFSEELEKLSGSNN